MKDLRLSLKKELQLPLECPVIKPESFIGKEIDQIKDLPAGSKKLGDYFKIYGDVSKSVDTQRVIMEGDLGRVNNVCEKMRGGEVLIEGDYGWHLGENMHQGKITVIGNTKGWIGTTMSGGEILIEGNVGDHVGCAVRGRKVGMNGGKIIIEGDAGTEVGYGLSGGEIFIKGEAHSFVGSYARSGKITIGDTAYGKVGNSMKGGEIHIMKSDYKAPIAFSEVESNQDYTKYIGDTSVHGKGSMLIHR